ncbi:hypothetical protein [Streptomyces sp. NBC_00443]|uniref:hypothetical protein n=1 Tax=Streptomyces sp. NBC_00443 TaxID=2975743 RepID=UPI002E1D85B0
MIHSPEGADWISVIVLAWIVLFGLGLAVQAAWRTARRRVLDQRPTPLDSYTASNRPRRTT